MKRGDSFTVYVQLDGERLTEKQAEALRVELAELEGPRRENVVQSLRDNGSDVPVDLFGLPADHDAVATVAKAPVAAAPGPLSS